MTKKELIRINIIFTMILLLSIAIHVGATEVKTITMKKSTVTDYNPYEVVILNLKSGDRVVGSFSVQGGYKINFGVADPSWSGVLSLEETNGAPFEFTAQRDGVFSLVFQHITSYGTEKTVTLSYDVNGPGSSGSASLDPLIIVLIVVIAILMVGLGFSIYRIRTRKREPTAPTPTAFLAMDV